MSTQQQTKNPQKLSGMEHGLRRPSLWFLNAGRKRECQRAGENLNR